MGKIARQNIKVLRDYASREPRPGHRRIVFRFFTSPVEIKGEGRVERIVLGRNELVTDGGRVVAKHTGDREELPAQLVVRAVGYPAASPPRGCRSTTTAKRFPTPTAGSRAVATSTSSAGSSAAPPELLAPTKKTPKTPSIPCSPT